MSAKKSRSRDVSVFDEELVLEEFLSDISHIYSGDRVNITVDSDTRSQFEMSDDICVSTDIRSEIGRPLNGPNKLRYIIDDLSHNIEHQKLSDFETYLSYIEMQDDDPSKLIALLVSVLLEDQYIDTNRVKKYRGHRKSIAFKRALYMRGSIRPPLTDLHAESAVIEAFIQIATAGYVKDADSLCKRDQKLMMWVKETIEKARRENSQQKRLEYVKEITTYLIKATTSNPYRAQKHIMNHPPSSYDFEPLVDESSMTTDVDDIETNLREYIRRKIRKLLKKLGFTGDDSPDEDYDLPDDAQSEKPLSKQEQRQKSKSDEKNEDGNIFAESGDDETLRELLEKSDEKELFNIDGEDDDIFTPTEAEKERFERLRETIIREELGDVIERQAERDNRIDNDSTSSQVLEKVEKRGLSDEVEDIFKKIKTKESRTNSVKGSRMNQRAVTRNISGDYTEQRLFYQNRTVELGNRTIGVSVDLSGSVNEVDAMVALGTLAKATDEIGDDFVATHFNNSESHLITSPREEFDWKHFDSVEAGGNTPTAKGILDIRHLIQDITNRERVMFVITDGKPNEGLSSSGKTPEKDSRAQVNEARKDNIKVIGLGLSGVDESNMKAMFGEDSYIMANEDTLASELLDAYRLQMGVVDDSGVNITT